MRARRSKLPSAVLAFVFATSSVTLGVRDAHAQNNEALAQRLFDDALELMEKGSFAEACPKLAESQRIDPGGGTLINLGACLEQDGKLASAYATYNDALTVAVRDGRKERETAAREHLASIAAQLSTVVVRASDWPGLEVRLDATVLGASAWGVPLPVDPGAHVVRATMPGKIPFEMRFEVPRVRSSKEVLVPTLAPVPAPAPSKEPLKVLVAPASEAPSNGSREPRSSSVPWVVGGTGVGLLIVGAVSGGLAFSSKSASDAACPTATTCTVDGAAAMDRARAFAWTSTVTMGLGLVGLGVATVLVLVSPNKSERTATAPAPAPAPMMALTLVSGGALRW